MRALAWLCASLVTTASLGTLTLGCKDDRPPETPENAPAPPAQTAEPAPTENPRGTGQSSVSIIGIQLDPTLASACGITPPKAFFELDSANVRPEAEPALASVAKCVNEGALRGRKLRIVGHADPRGDDEYNKQLGKTRAEAVAEELTRRGIDRAKINTVSRGEEKATGEGPAGYAYDRRVDIRLEP